MTIINATLNGEQTYDITISGGEIFRVSAFTLDDAIDRIADHIEQHENTDLYIDEFTLAIIADCSRWKTAEAYAKAHDFTRCGTNGIYLEITSIKGCPNG